MALFSFLQAEFPWALGPADGRYLLRDKNGEPQYVVVLSTLGAPRRHRLRGRRATRPATPDPAPVTVARATVIEAEAIPDERLARGWLARVDDETVHGGLDVVNRVVLAHRIAAADGAVHEVTAGQAIVVRAGYGEGEDVADGHWRQARELTARPRRVRRTAALRPQERLSLLLSGHGEALVVEEFALRARQDLDGGRLVHAAWELRSAYEIGLPELAGEGREDLRDRLAELGELRASVSAPAPDAAALEHALARLEAALRARTATGFARLVEEGEGVVSGDAGPPLPDHA